MAKAEPIATNPLATARQLWALNRAGALRLYIPGAAWTAGPLSAQQADLAIKAIATDRATKALAPDTEPAPADPEHFTIMRGIYQQARKEHKGS